MNNAERAGTSVLFLTDRGRERIVVLDSHQYRVRDKQSMEEMSQQVMSQLQAGLQNLPPEQRVRVEQMMKGGVGPGGQAAGSRIRITYTAKGSGSVNGFACTKYEGTRGAAKVVELCAAKPSDFHFNAADFEVFQKMREFGASLGTGLAGGVGVSPFAATRVSELMEPGFDSFPVQHTWYGDGLATTKMEVKSIERANFSEADFSLGSAKKVDLIPGRR
jgi:hypothetical protein